VNHLTREDVKKQTCCNPLGIGEISVCGFQVFEMAKEGEEHVGETLSIGRTYKRDDIHALCNKSKRTIIIQTFIYIWWRQEKKKKDEKQKIYEKAAVPGKKKVWKKKRESRWKGKGEGEGNDEKKRRKME
jgi:hypothetical protein